MFRNDSLIAETADTLYLDMTADTGYIEYAIGVRWEADSVFAVSEPLTATTQDYRQGAEAYRFVVHNGEDIGNVAIYYPSGNWYTSYRDSVLTSVYEYDYNRDGIIDLSDFGFFAESNPTQEEKEWFLDMYGLGSLALRLIQEQPRLHALFLIHQ